MAPAAPPLAPHGCAQMGAAGAARRPSAPRFARVPGASGATTAMGIPMVRVGPSPKGRARLRSPTGAKRSVGLQLRPSVSKQRQTGARKRRASRPAQAASRAPAGSRTSPRATRAAPRRRGHAGTRSPATTSRRRRSTADACGRTRARLVRRRRSQHHRRVDGAAMTGSNARNLALEMIERAIDRDVQSRSPTSKEALPGHRTHQIR